MSVLRFVGRTTREAMSALREALGPDALVLANRPCPEGVELLAAAPDDLRAWQRSRSAESRGSSVASPEPAAVAAPAEPMPANVPAEPMSTVSFQEYVRDRLRQPRAAEAPVAPVRPAPARLPQGLNTSWWGGDMPRAERVAPAPELKPERAPEVGVNLIQEMQALKDLITHQYAELGWFEGVRRSPVQGRLLKTMVGNGFSLRLARSIVSRLPSDYSEREAQQWLEEVVAANLRCASPEDVFLGGGVFALVGPTGVGKTTTTAKIAAAHVLAHGPQSVSLVTVDTYRMGAHDQLRAFGRLLGVPVHVAHDAAALQDLLRMRHPRQLVLIDTIGLGHRDERVKTLLLSLPKADIQHVVVSSCAAQAEAIDESLRAYEARYAAGIILTKLDEAARLGGALDCVVRQRIRVLGTCDGQRVPEDWHAADPAALARRALLGEAPHAFSLDDEDLPLIFGVAAATQRTLRHA